MSRKAGDRINRLRERMGDDYDRVAGSGLQGGITAPGIDSSDNHYSAAEVTAELRNRGDRTVNEGDNSMMNYFQGLADDGSKFNAKARAKLEGIGVNFSDNSSGVEEGIEDPVETTPEPVDTPTPTPTEPEDSDPVQTIEPIYSGPRTGGQTQNVNQDNDVNTSITGDGNNVDVNQDNSISQNGFGGAGSFKDAWMRNYFN